MIKSYITHPSKMTRKHFKAIAESIATIKEESHRLTAIEAILPTLQGSNPRFDTSRFLQACQPKA
jgi:hypothetical protein